MVGSVVGQYSRLVSCPSMLCVKSNLQSFPVAPSNRLFFGKTEKQKFQEANRVLYELLARFSFLYPTFGNSRLLLWSVKTYYNLYSEFPNLKSSYPFRHLCGPPHWKTRFGYLMTNKPWASCMSWYTAGKCYIAISLEHCIEQHMAMNNSGTYFSDSLILLRGGL